MPSGTPYGRKARIQGCDPMDAKSAINSSSYTLQWLQDIMVPSTEKVGLTAAAIVAEHLFGIFDIMFFAVMSLWGFDFLAGIVRVIRTKETFAFSKALDSTLKIIIYVIVLGTCSAAGIVAESLVGFDATNYFISGAYAVIAWTEVGSIIRNVVAAYPSMRQAFSKLGKLAPKPIEEEKDDEHAD